MSLDLLAAQAVLQARLLERAVHDRGRWTMTCGSQSVAAQRFVTDEGITFLGDFIDGLPAATVTLECDGQPLSVRQVDASPASGAITLRWDINAVQVRSPQR